MGRGRAPLRSICRPPAWSVFLTAMVGAWLGHFVEYVRVAGWHAGLADMTSASHAYFLPGGAALVATAVAASFCLGRLWLSLGRRLRLAQFVLRRPHGPSPGPAPAPVRSFKPLGGRGLALLWVVLSALQLAIWLAQENLEAVAGGQKAPLLAVISGAHVWAPVVQAEIALILAGAYLVVHGRLRRRQTQVWALERLVARRWRRTAKPSLLPWSTPAFGNTPLDRWGAQRWQRPPPLAA